MIGSGIFENHGQRIFRIIHWNGALAEALWIAGDNRVRSGRQCCLTDHGVFKIVKVQIDGFGKHLRIDRGDLKKR